MDVVKKADGGSKMPTGERYSAIDTSGQVKREDNDKYSGQAAESSSKSSGQINRDADDLL